ncbi:hypothetical protein ACJX0J_023770 [Zea mays]
MMICDVMPLHNPFYIVYDAGDLLDLGDRMIDKREMNIYNNKTTFKLGPICISVFLSVEHVIVFCFDLKKEGQGMLVYEIRNSNHHDLSTPTYGELSVEYFF